MKLWRVTFRSRANGHLYAYTKTGRTSREAINAARDEFFAETGRRDATLQSVEDQGTITPNHS